MASMITYLISWSTDHTAGCWNTSPPPRERAYFSQIFTSPTEWPSLPNRTSSSSVKLHCMYALHSLINYFYKEKSRSCSIIERCPVFQYRYRCQKYWLKGPEKGTVESFIDNLPGLPDNIHYDGNGTFWIGVPTVMFSTQFNNYWTFSHLKKWCCLEYILAVEVVWIRS